MNKAYRVGWRTTRVTPRRFDIDTSDKGSFFSYVNSREDFSMLDRHSRFRTSLA